MRPSFKLLFGAGDAWCASRTTAYSFTFATVVMHGVSAQVPSLILTGGRQSLLRRHFLRPTLPRGNRLPQSRIRTEGEIRSVLTQERTDHEVRPLLTFLFSTP